MADSAEILRLKHEIESLRRDNELLLQDRSRLNAALEEARRNSVEPTEVLRAIQYGEIDALVLQQEGEAEIYSLQRFDSIYLTVVEECFPYGVWLTKQDGTLLYISPSFLNVLRTDVAEMQQKGQFHFLPEETREVVETEWARCRETKNVFNIEYTITLEDGSTRCIWTQGLLAQTHDGLTHWVGINVDITDRRRVEEALQQSEGRFRIALNAARMFVWEWRLADDLFTVSEGAGDIVGFAPNDAIATASQVFAMVHVNDLPVLQRAVAEAVRLRQGFCVEFRTIRESNGATRWLENRADPIFGPNGVVIGFLGVTLDVDERKRLETDRQNFVTLAETSSEFIGMCDMSGNPFFVNEAGLRLAGLDGLEHAKRTPVGEFFFAEDQKMILDEFFPQVLREGRAEIEVRFRNFKSGQPIWMTYTAFVLRDRGGQAIGLATVSRNISEYKRLNEDLQEQASGKDEFLATLAHELRNPLAPIRNAVQVLKLQGSQAAEVVWCRDVIERQVGQMARLLDDLLDVSRITRNSLELRKERVALADILEIAVETSRPLINGSNHNLTVSLPNVPVYLDADPVRLAQVYANLLNNAAKYTERGGRIDVTVTLVGEEVSLTVKDSGIGITPELLPRLFKMFSQGTPALERSQGGLGIGLSLAKGLVEKHGGSVVAHSEGTGKGSEFVVRLPVAVKPVATPQASTSGQTPGNVRRKILVADDNKDAADSLSMLLLVMGNDVRTASDGQEALEIASEFRPDVILLDIGMPRLNGYDTCHRIREQPWGKNILIVAVTGWGQQEDRRRSTEVRFDHHMVKPVAPAELEKLLRFASPVHSANGLRSGG